MAQSPHGPGFIVELVALAILLLATTCLAQRPGTTTSWRPTGYFDYVDLRLPVGSTARGKVVLETGRFQLWLEGDANNKCSLSVREKYINRPIWRRHPDRGFLVWSANYNSPTAPGADKCTLAFTGRGDLQLYADYKGNNSRIWSSKTGHKGVTRMALQTSPDRGNFQLLTGSDQAVFSSFDVKEWLIVTGQQFREGERLNSPDRVYPGNDSLVLANSGSYSLALNGGDLQLLCNGPGAPQVYWSLKRSAGVTADLSHVKYAARIEDAAQGIGLFTARGKLVYRIAVPPFVPARGADFNFALDFDGNLNYNLMDRGLEWMTGWQAITNYCDLPRFCGNYGLCTPTPDPLAANLTTVAKCTGCPPGFGPDRSTTPASCKRLRDLNKCHHWQYGQALKGYEMAGLPTPMRKSFGDCKVSCSLDCNCDGFFYNFRAGTCTNVTQFLTLKKSTVDIGNVAYIKI